GQRQRSGERGRRGKSRGHARPSRRDAARRRQSEAPARAADRALTRYYPKLKSFSRRKRPLPYSRDRAEARRTGRRLGLGRQGRCSIDRAHFEPAAVKRCHTCQTSCERIAMSVDKTNKPVKLCDEDSRVPKKL